VTTFNATPPAPQSGGLFSNRLLLGALAVLALCACCFCAAAGIGYWAYSNGMFGDAAGQDGPRLPLGNLSREQAKAATAAGTFVQTLQSGNWTAAYALCTPTLQRQLGNPAALGQAIAAAKSQPASALTVGDVSPINSSDTSASVNGTARFNNKTGAVLIDLERIGTDWKVNGFSLNQ